MRVCDVAGVHHAESLGDLHVPHLWYGGRESPGQGEGGGGRGDGGRRVPGASREIGARRAFLSSELSGETVHGLLSLL